MADWDSAQLGSITTISDIEAIATYTLPVDTTASFYGHHFVGVGFFSDANGTPATPSSGSYEITVETKEMPGIFQQIINGVVQVTSLASVNFAGNPLNVKIIPNLITDASHFRINLVSNRT